MRRQVSKRNKPRNDIFVGDIILSFVDELGYSMEPVQVTSIHIIDGHTYYRAYKIGYDPVWSTKILPSENYMLDPNCRAFYNYQEVKLILDSFLAFCKWANLEDERIMLDVYLPDYIKVVAELAACRDYLLEDHGDKHRVTRIGKVNMEQLKLFADLYPVVEEINTILKTDSHTFYYTEMRAKLNDNSKYN